MVPTAGLRFNLTVVANIIGTLPKQFQLKLFSIKVSHHSLPHTNMKF